MLGSSIISPVSVHLAGFLCGHVIYDLLLTRGAQTLPLVYKGIRCIVVQQNLHLTGPEPSSLDQLAAMEHV